MLRTLFNTSFEYKKMFLQNFRKIASTIVTQQIYFLSHCRSNNYCSSTTSVLIYLSTNPYIIYIVIVLSIKRSLFWRKPSFDTNIYQQIKKKKYQFHVLIYISKQQQPDGNLKLAMWSVTIIEQEIEENLLPEF